MQRFVFDRDFDAEIEDEGRGPGLDVPAPTLAELEALMEQARAEGEAAGLARGRAEAEAELRATLEADTATTLAALLPELTALRAGRTAHHQALEQDLLRMTQVLASQLVPEIEARFGQRRLIAFCRQALRIAGGPGGMELRLNPAMLEPVRGALDAALHSAGSPVKLVADPALAPGEARASWDQGQADFALPRLHASLLDTLTCLSTPTDPDRS